MRFSKFYQKYFPILGVLCVLIHTAVAQRLGSITERFDRHIEINPDYSVSWRFYGDSFIIFQIIAQYPSPNSYIGFGISQTGRMDGSDILIIKCDYPNESSLNFNLEDRHGVGNKEPELDESQDWHFTSGEANRTHILVKILRDLKTRDEKHDLEITTDTLQLIWAVGEYDLVTGNLFYHKNTGSISTNFLDRDVETPTVEELEKKYEVWKTEQTVQLPGNETFYRCSFFKGPKIGRKHQIVGFGMHIDHPENKRHVFDAGLYRCTAPDGVNPDEFFAPFLGNGYDCNYSPVPFPSENCGTFEFQWTIGGKITLFPDNLGFPLGDDDGTVEYFMTEVHYENPDRRSDLKIRAGFNIYHTPSLRPTEIGQIQLGFMTNKTYSLTIPPNSENFVVSSHCAMECTQNLPEDGINVFNYLLHSHLAGRRLKLRHFRNGKELPFIGKDDHFDFNYQNNRGLQKHVKILPGDHLTMECVYDSTYKRGRVTLGGGSLRDEMCAAFLLYWPRVGEVNSCGSYHSHEEIMKFMGIDEVYQYQGEKDATVISPRNLAGLKYSHAVEHLVNWSPEVRKKYQELVQYGEQQAYCLPVAWNNETFVRTRYPQVENIVESVITISDILIFIGVVIVVLVMGICLVIFFVKMVIKRRLNKQVDALLTTFLELLTTFRNII